MVDHVKSEEDDPAAAAEAAREKASVRSKAERAVSLGKRRLKASAITGLRSVVPLMEAYTDQRAAEQPNAAERGTLGLNRGENAVLKAGTGKLFLEMVEIASRTHPAFPDAPAFKAFDEAGKAQKPHLMHLLALGTAARTYLARDDEKGGGEPGPDEGDPGEATVIIAPDQTVVLVPVAPGEYALQSGPMAPAEMRRMAMRQRSYAPPPAARLLSAANASTPLLGPAGGGAPQGAAAPRVQGQQMQKAQSKKGQAPAQAGKGSSTALATQAAASGSGSGCGCGCGASGGGCASCGGGPTRFSPPRLDPEGNCAPLWKISCETQWRLRESFKLAICDALRCINEQVCDEDGQLAQNPDFSDCLDTFVCSLLGSLPDALCAAPPQQQKCCPAPEPGSCGAGDDCNFAVGD